MDVSKLPQREKVKTVQPSKCAHEQRYNRVSSFQNISGLSGLIQKKRNLTRHLNRDDLMQGIRPYRKWRPARAKGALRIESNFGQQLPPLGSESKASGGSWDPEVWGGTPQGPAHSGSGQQLGTGTNFCYQEGKRAAAENSQQEVKRKKRGPFPHF